jgi:signal transduction histidine kinase
MTCCIYCRFYQNEYPQSNPTIDEETEAIELDFLIEDIPRLLDSMKSGADRIRKIVLSLRNFSRLDEAAKKRVDIHEGIESTLLILQNQLKDIELVKEFGELPQVECYSAQINQVFMNLLANAIDALKHKYHGVNGNNLNKLPVHEIPRMTIRTEVTNSESVKIIIADNGTGIPDNIKQRIFDPFFTTKSVGSGTGLGLSVSYQIVVEKHRGNLSCNSQSGEGSEFIIELPIRLSNS